MTHWRKIISSCLALFLWLNIATLAYGQEAESVNEEASVEVAAVDGDPKKGKELFNSKCTACHKLDSKFIGPALGGVVTRLQEEQGLGTDWLHKWIVNNEELRASGDEYANQVFQEFNEVPMTPFPELSDGDVDNILAYLENPPAEEPVAAASSTTADQESEAGDNSMPLGVLIVGFIVLIALLLLILYKLNTLVRLNNVSALSPAQEEDLRGLNSQFNKFSKFGYPLLALLGLLALWGAWRGIIGLGVDEGYQPEQPIYFSHKIHAGEQQIDCQYCHSSAKYGKVSGIPSTNVCMNCHYTIQEYNGEYVEDGKSKEFYTEEMQKIYAAIGFDKANLAYTGEQDPIEWTRIHNMPDFVYFNHAQHVVAGEHAIKEAKDVEQVCYACHGQVDEMDEVYMANEFTMGWCIECHRETEVDMNNEYNKEYYSQLHDRVKEVYGDEATITVDAIGGLECGKCHY